MYNATFYPTPAPVAERMLAMLGELDWRKLRILEPSAGKGDLADALIASIRVVTLSDGRQFVRRAVDLAATIHCIEPDPDLQASLRGKGYHLVAHDFLTFSPEEPYNLIIMNPPFADGDRHVLHAWEILEEGEVTEDIAALVILLEKSGVIREYFSRYEQKEMKERLAAITKSPEGAMVKEMLDYVNSMLDTIAVLITVFS